MANYHEPFEILSEKDRNFSRALASLKEEIEAIDWYHQRVSTCQDESLKAVLAHNRDEEIEHATMTLEWLRRNDATFDKFTRRYLFKDADIIAIEEAADEEAAGGGKGGAAPPDPSSHRSLGIGSLRGS